MTLYNATIELDLSARGLTPTMRSDHSGVNRPRSAARIRLSASPVDRRPVAHIDGDNQHRAVRSPT
ncbi:MAG: hypothetical protein LBE08_00065 [Bifidobacteriaceae bacterium]|jgi:hypothetical protein|nr:hypothetical protein [Bifidobacteriaceae bacterium]